MKLSTPQVDQFFEDGFLLIEDAFSQEDLQPAIDEIDAETDRAAQELMAEGKLSRDYSNESFETRVSKIYSETPEILSTFRGGKLHGRGMFSILRHPKLLDMMESLVGPEIIAAGVYRLRVKVRGWEYGAVPWHQDSAFFEPFCDSSLIVTAWIPLVDSTPERGCLQMMPGYHMDETLIPHNKIAPDNPLYEITTANLPPGKIVTMPVMKGGVLLFTNRTPHCSTENETDIVRWSLDFRYQNTDLPTDYKLPDGSEFRESTIDAEPVACFPPQSDLLVRSLKHPEAVVTDWARFAKIRENHLGQPVSLRWDY